MSIIGISGRINSGKDTVGRIIQYLDAKSKKEREKEIAPKLFLPDVEYPTFEDWCKPRLHESGYDIGHLSMYKIHSNSWVIKKFAGKLKQIATILTGIPIENFEDQEFKKTEMDDVWAVNRMPITVRQFLQRLGTEAIRDNLHPNAWVNALLADYKGDNWIITDLRFPNEFAALKRKDALLIRVIRPGLEYADHISETALDSYVFDEEIVNDGTIDDLINKVKTMMERRNLL